MAWEDIEPPMGAFIGWGQKKGQKVVGKVTEYDEFGGTDYNGKECPLLEIELTEKAASFNKKGERTNHDPGETVLLSCGQINLKKKIKRAELAHGDLIRIVLDDFLDTANGTVKEFTVQVDRSTRSAKRTTGSSSSARGSSASNDMDDDDEPDF